MGDNLYASGAGVGKMLSSSVEQNEMIKGWVEKARETIETTALKEDARAGIEQTLREIEPVLKDFVNVMNTAIDNFENTGKNLVTTANNIANPRG